MSTAFSQRMQKLGTRLLTKYGSSVSLVRSGDKVWDEVAGEYTQAPDIVLKLNAVPVPVNAALINDTAIRAGDMVIKADATVTPDMDDKIDFSGERWSVVAIERKIVNDDTVAWFIQVRK